MSPLRISRRLVLLGVVGGVSGCLSQLRGDDDDAENVALEPASQLGDIRLTSPAFTAGEQIPTEYGYDEANVNPPLEIDNVPESADSLVLVVDDPDAVDVAGKIWIHWLVWNIPPETTHIPEDWSPSTARVGTNDFDELGYGGPSPPDEAHTYRFKLYAMNQSVDLESGATVDELGPRMSGNIEAQTQLVGTYPA